MSASTSLGGRQDLLQRIRAANGRTTPLDEAMAAWQAVPRTYKSAASRSPEAILELLADRLRDYDARVEQVTRVGVAGAIAQALAERGNPRMLIPQGLSPGLLPEGNFTIDAGGGGFSPAELDRFDGVLTEATLAIAETGTLVLQNVAGQGRRAATLVPDFHLCVLRAEDVVETVPEAVRHLEATATLPTTFISGPSATADIEMTRIKGVHGPRFLHVLLVEA